MWVSVCVLLCFAARRRCRRRAAPPPDIVQTFLESGWCNIAKQATAQTRARMLVDATAQTPRTVHKT